ncbi:MAG: hypothetical protein P8L35_07435 [Acidimicrobiales bacterium]|nr:hypothetical protein [Acidimicrobiales bacterium]
MPEEEENREDENPADFEEEEFPDDIEDEEDLESAPLDADTDDDEDDEDDEDESGPAPTPDSNDDDPADVEADLDAILKDRIASGEDEDDETGESVAPKKEVAVQGDDDSIEARRKGEVTCPSCFLIIESQIAKEIGECPHCGGSV